MRNRRYILVPWATDHLAPDAPDHTELDSPEWHALANVSTRYGYSFYETDDGFDGDAAAAMKTALKRALGQPVPPKPPERQPANEPPYQGPKHFVVDHRAAPPPELPPLSALEQSVAEKMLAYLENLGRRGFGVAVRMPR